jgi:hypothetical protein
MARFSFVACSQQPVSEKENVATEENRIYTSVIKQFEKNGAECTEPQKFEVIKLADS